MDAERFDHMTRAVAASANRRSLLRSGVAGALALVGLRAFHQPAAADDGFEGSPCDSGDDCRTGLVCVGNGTGLLGGSLAGTVGPGVYIPLTDGKTGRCQYHSNTDNCGRVDQACESNSDCCNGLGLTCQNKKCKR